MSLMKLFGLLWCIMHGSGAAGCFSRDLVKMRLATARAYVKVLTDGQVSEAAYMMWEGRSWLSVR